MPAKVRRILRQEAGFGCANCGHPYFEYHHIIPWAEERHFRAEDMVALCPSCHVMVAKLDREKQYTIKGAPKNKIDGNVRGNLICESKELNFLVGSVNYIDTPTIFQFQDTPIIACRQEDGQILVSMIVLDSQCNQLLVIRDNEIAFRSDDLWDFEYKHNLVKARYGPADIAVTLDFRKSPYTIMGRIWYGDTEVRLSPTETAFPNEGGYIAGGSMVGCLVGIQIGPPDIPLPMRCKWNASKTAMV